MTANQHLLNRLFDEGRIVLKRASFLDQPPSAHARGAAFEKVEGMLLGLAVGDVLGNTSESLSPGQRTRAHGEITDYLVHPYANERRGFPSDDSQLAFWTLEQLLADDGLVPENLARRFTGGRIFGIGATVSEFLANFKAGKPWYESGPRSAGNGALMRIAPVLVPHLREASAALWADTVLCAMMTRNDAGSTACCADDSADCWQPIARHPTPLEALVLAETVESLLAGFSGREQEIVALRLQGYTERKISESVGRSEALYTAKSRVLRRLRKEVEGMMEQG